MPVVDKKRDEPVIIDNEIEVANLVVDDEAFKKPLVVGKETSLKGKSKEVTQILKPIPRCPSLFPQKSEKKSKRENIKSLSRY